MALLIMLDLNIAQKFGGDMDTLDRLESRIDHSSMGLIIASLFILRLVFRYKYGPPDYQPACQGGKSFQQNLDTMAFIF